MISCCCFVLYRVRQKSILKKDSANFSTTVKSYNTKFCTHVTHSIIRKCERFHYIIYRIYKITLLLVMAN